MTDFLVAMPKEISGNINANAGDASNSNNGASVATVKYLPISSKIGLLKKKRQIAKNLRD